MRQAKIFQPELDGPITMQEVFAALRKLKSGKAPGEDGVLADIIRTGQTQWAPARCAATPVWSRHWC